MTSRRLQSSRPPHQARMPRQRWSLPFVASAAVLLLAGMGLESTIGKLKEHYRKLPIAPRIRLVDFDAQALRSFKSAPDDSPFVDPVSDDEVGGDDMLMLRLQEQDATGVGEQVLLFVTYYSDADDRVPHTPEVCYRQIGAKVQSVNTVTIQATAPGNPRGKIAVRTVIAEEEGATAVIAFVFCVNGDFHLSRNDVRFALGMPGDKYVYFSKIEAIARADPGADTSRALNRCLQLLAEAIPELVKTYFPAEADLTR